jgi:hypothetical protein
MMARRFCEGRRIRLIDLYDFLHERLESIMPDGYRISTCGSCGRYSAVPTPESLRRLRTDLFTQKAVADRAEICVKHVTAMERGNRVPTERVVEVYVQLAAEARERTVGP